MLAVCLTKELYTKIYRCLDMCRYNPLVWLTEKFVSPYLQKSNISEFETVEESLKLFS